MFALATSSPTNSRELVVAESLGWGDIQSERRAPRSDSGSRTGTEVFARGGALSGVEVERQLDVAFRARSNSL
ncbi:MAG: hypothetical protein ACI835_002862 [Planctomycetota bacterium]|jgi:hypothetical protein